MTLPEKHTSFVLLLGLSLFGACKSTETTPADQVALGLNKSARVGTDLTVRVDTLNDSRCQRNVSVVCIWEGEVVVSLSLSKDAETQKRRLKLRGFSDRFDSTTVQFSNTPYKIVLKAVTPYPGEGSGDKQAVIQVTKL